MLSATPAASAICEVRAPPRPLEVNTVGAAARISALRSAPVSRTRVPPAGSATEGYHLPARGECSLTSCEHIPTCHTVRAVRLAPLIGGGVGDDGTGTRPGPGPT